MNSIQWRQILETYRAIAVIRCYDLDLGRKMASSVAMGGMRLIEITWNSKQPGQLIRQLRRDLPDCIIGTGTITTFEQLQEAMQCGSQFCFTPYVNLALIEAAMEANIPIIPGALSPTEIVTAWQAGASCVKVFPIEAVGGVKYIKSLQGPLSEIPLIPTGGVTLDNAKQLIQSGAIAVGLAGDLFPKALIEAHDWEGITERASYLNLLLNQI